MDHKYLSDLLLTQIENSPEAYHVLDQYLIIDEDEFEDKNRLSAELMAMGMLLHDPEAMLKTNLIGLNQKKKKKQQTNSFLDQEGSLVPKKTNTSFMTLERALIGDLPWSQLWIQQIHMLKTVTNNSVIEEDIASSAYGTAANFSALDFFGPEHKSSIPFCLPFNCASILTRLCHLIGDPMDNVVDYGICVDLWSFIRHPELHHRLTQNAISPLSNLLRTVYFMVPTISSGSTLTTICFPSHYRGEHGFESIHTLGHRKGSAIQSFSEISHAWINNTHSIREAMELNIFPDDIDNILISRAAVTYKNMFIIGNHTILPSEVRYIKNGAEGIYSMSSYKLLELTPNKIVRLGFDTELPKQKKLWVPHITENSNLVTIVKKDPTEISSGDISYLARPHHQKVGIAATQAKNALQHFSFVKIIEADRRHLRLPVWYNFPTHFVPYYVTFLEHVKDMCIYSYRSTLYESMLSQEQVTILDHTFDLIDYLIRHNEERFFTPLKMFRDVTKPLGTPEEFDKLLRLQGYEYWMIEKEKTNTPVGKLWARVKHYTQIINTELTKQENEMVIVFNQTNSSNHIDMRDFGNENNFIAFTIMTFLIVTYEHYFLDPFKNTTALVNKEYTLQKKYIYCISADKLHFLKLNG